MRPKLLLDTHVLNRYFVDPRKLSKEQNRAIDSALRGREPVAFSSVSLMEIAYLSSQGRFKVKLEDFFADLRNQPMFQILALDFEVAAEISELIGLLRDPMDTTIVATARVHRLKLLTLDQRIIDSKLVSVID